MNGRTRTEREWRPRTIALESYRRYVATLQAIEARPVVDVLRGYAALPEIINLDQGLPDLSDEQLQTTLGFRQNVRGQLELRVPHGTVTRLLADWEARKDSA